MATAKVADVLKAQYPLGSPASSHHSKPADKSCPECGSTIVARWAGSGWTQVDICLDCWQRQQFERDMTAAREKMQARMLSVNGLTCGVYGRMTFDSYQPSTAKQRAALEHCRAVADGWTTDNYGRGVLLYSPLSAVGVGKTHLAVSMARAACENLHSITVIGVNEYLDAIRDSFDKDRDESTAKVRDRVLDPDVLVFDDLGAEATGRLDWYKSQIYTVFDARWRESKATVVTTNLSLTEIAGLIGERGVSRLVAMTGPAIELDGKDYRLKGARR